MKTKAFPHWLSRQGAGLMEAPSPWAPAVASQNAVNWQAVQAEAIQTLQQAVP
jgi:hypothetical protein